VAKLQRLVDALASRCERAIVLEDRRQRMIVYSEHAEPIDQVRSESILSRRTTPEVMAWLRQFEITTATGPVRTPAREDLGLLPRVCVPIRHQDLLLGFLWFVDPDGSITDDELERVVASTDAFALALYRENLAGELATRRESEAIRNLMIAEPEVQIHAAQDLFEADQFSQSAGVVALVARPVLRDGHEPDDLLRLAIEQALVDTRRRVGPRRALHLVRFDHGLLLTAVGEGAAPTRETADRLRHDLRQACTGLDAVERVLVGVGQAREHLADARASYAEARQAVDVAVHLRAAGPIAEWAQLGIYRALAHLSAEQLGAASIHPGLDRLLEDPQAEPLVETLETYLDLAGNAQATSEQLTLHRTSLYHRLRRIEELCQADLKDGNERLALHLGLKLARLSGRR
jgi:hypothetical protein